MVGSPHDLYFVSYFNRFLLIAKAVKDWEFGIQEISCSPYACASITYENECKGEKSANKRIHVGNRRESTDLRITRSPWNWNFSLGICIAVEFISIMVRIDVRKVNFSVQIHNSKDFQILREVGLDLVQTLVNLQLPKVVFHVKIGNIFLEDLVNKHDANDKTYMEVVMYGVDWPH